MGLCGWAGVAYCLFFTLPTLGPRWLFFFFLVLGVCGTILPVISFLHRRFPATPAADGNVIIRQDLWWGTFIALIVWLQLGRALSSNRTIFLAIGFIVMEMLIRLLETSRWKPAENENEMPKRRVRAQRTDNTAEKFAEYSKEKIQDASGANHANVADVHREIPRLIDDDLD